MNIKLKESRQWRTVWRIATEGDTLDRLFDDMHKGTHAEFKARIRGVVANPENHTFFTYWQKKLAGCFVMVLVTPGCYEIHTLLLEAYRGLIGVRIGRYATNFTLNLPYVQRLVSYCPDCIPQSYLFAKMCGWSFYGILPMRWVKNGISYQIKGVGIRKGELTCPC